MANAQTYGERPVCQIGRKGATWKLFVAAGWQSNIKFSKYIEITQGRDMQRTKCLITVGGVRFPRHGNASTQSPSRVISSKNKTKSGW